MKRTSLAILATLLMMASTTFAATGATGTTVSPTLQISANVQSAVQLTLSTGTNLAGTSCVINAGGNPPDYTMSFGNVDALAINAVTCGAKYPASGGSNAVYYTDYQVTPTFAGQASNTASGSIKAYVSANGMPSSVTIVRDSANTGTNPADATQFTAMPNTLATAYSIATGPLTSGTALHPFVGVAISTANGAGTSGAGTATITYVLTVQ